MNQVPEVLLQLIWKITMMRIGFDDQIRSRSFSQSKCSEIFSTLSEIKNAVKLVHQQIAETKEEIAYLESVLAQLEIASPMDLAVIREELIAQGYVKNRTKQRKKPLLRNQNDFFLQTEQKFSLEKQFTK